MEQEVVQAWAVAYCSVPSFFSLSLSEALAGAPHEAFIPSYTPHLFYKWKEIESEAYEKAPGSFKYLQSDMSHIFTQFQGKWAFLTGNDRSTK